MKTSKEYTNNINERIITAKMLGEATYSANKRAKNWREKAQEYYSTGYSNRSYNFYDKYSFKNASSAKENKEEYYDMKETLLSIVTPDCVHKLARTDHNEWFFFYIVGDYTFHSPVNEKTALSSGLNIIEIENLHTEGKEITELVSVNFIKKIIELINSGNFTYVSNDNIPIAV